MTEKELKELEKFAKENGYNEELEKRIETLEKEVQHLKAVLQYQMRNKKK